jgi:trehalose 6-phosphate phosphatase
MPSNAFADETHRTLSAPPRLEPRTMALFADLDGTLAPIAPRPQDVRFDAERTRLLKALSRALGGRLAVVSGRGLDDIDRVLGGAIPAVAAAHGLVRRTAAGAMIAAPDALPPPAREAFLALAHASPGLFVEDKGPAMALHYRGAPEAGPASEAAAEALAQRYGLALQKGLKVVELRAPGPTKADAVASFLREPPFAGARPVFLGDDLTDEDGFAAAGAFGGYGVIVGPRRPTAAAYALADVPAALAWLSQALQPDGQGPVEPER